MSALRLHTRKGQGGFSLVELSILLAVLGMLAVTMLSSGLLGKEKFRLTETEEKMEKIQAAIQVYYNRNGHLPCPASGQEAPDTANFGMSTTCSAGATAGVDDVLSTAPGAGADDEMRIGVVPTRTLLLPDSYMNDEWGSRFSFAVVKKLATTSGDFTAYQTSLMTGVIEINDETGAQLTPAATADVNGYALISHGKDRKGAYSKLGTVGYACGSSTTAQDAHNCNNNDTVFVTTEINDDEGAEAAYFYDLVRYASTDELVEAAEAASSSSSSSTSSSSSSSSSGGGGGAGEGSGSGSSSSGGGPGGSPNASIAAATCNLQSPINSTSSYACGVASTGRAYCWGNNAESQLGDGTTTSSDTPVEVSGGYTDWKQIRTDFASTCGLRADGTDSLIYCWGDNAEGQLGNSTTTDSTTPTLISGGYTDWAAIDNDRNHACALRSNGRLYCWGDNADGQLGNGTTTDSTAPAEVSGTYTNWSYVTTGYQYSCGIRLGHAYCWGENSYGKLGDGTTTDSTTPVEVTGSYGNWTQLSSNNHNTCGLRGGHAYCWGENLDGEGGNGGTTSSSIPVEVSGGFSDWAYIDAGREVTCGIRNGGRAYCWGDNANGALGDGTTTDSTTPVQVSGAFTDYTWISPHLNATCALRQTDNKYYCWGNNADGNLGDGTTTDSLTPVAVTGLTPFACGYGADCSSTFVEADGGDDVSYALMPDGNAYIWGNNSTGVFGNGTTTNSSTPVQAGTYTDWFAFSADSEHTTACGIRENGRLYCWGARDNGLVGDGGATVGNQLTPIEVAGGYNDWSEVDVDHYHACARRGFGQVYCWGLNDRGQLGDGTLTNRTSPVEISGGYNDWSDIDTGGYHSCGVRNSGEAYCWGYNANGALGDGTTTNSSTPVLVSGGFTDWKWIGMELSTTCGVRLTGNAYCWGNNNTGQMGDGTTTNSSIPVEVSGATTDWAFIKGGDTTSCGIRAGAMYCWGKRDYGLVADGGATAGNQLTPALVTGGLTDWAFVQNATENACASTDSGDVYCWGRNDVGQVGDGTTTERDVPTEVTGMVNGCAVAGACTTIADVAFTTGVEISCAVGDNTKAYCWGRNSAGHFGNGDTTSSSSPVTAYGGTTGWVKIVNDVSPATLGHTCALNESGEIYCAGYNAGVLGQLGINSAVDGTYTTPQLVSGGFTDWVDLDADYPHTCALRSTGQLYCWGRGDTGATGDGNALNDNHQPTLVAGGITNWTAINTGAAYSCALRATGQAYCWGQNNYGQIGDGATTTQKNSPTLVAGGYTDWQSVDAGAFTTCGKRATGQAYCWGRGDLGQRGDNDTTANQLSPVEIDGAFTDWTAISADSGFGCGIRGGNIYCWGDRTELPVQGDGGGAVGTQLTPSLILDGIGGWANVKVEAQSACAINNNGKLYCWGDDAWGDNGDGGADTPQTLPVQVSGLPSYDLGNLCATPTCRISVAAWGGTSTAINYDGKAYAWGGNTAGVFGDGTTLPSDVPTQAATTASDWLKLTGDFSNSAACGIQRNGTLWCWGNRAKYIGDGGAIVGNQLTPVQIGSTYTDWSDVELGDSNGCALRSSGRLYCWGLNVDGQVGDGTTTGPRLTPTEVSGSSTDWIYLGGVELYACGIRGADISTGGTAYCWGRNTSGQIGDNTTTTPRSTPTLVLGGFTDWTMISLESAHTCGVRASGAGYCWGLNTNGRLGDGTTTERHVPTQISGAFTDWTQIFAGHASSCGMRGGRLYCWGIQTDGMIGDGLGGTGNQLTPKEVAGGFTDWEAVNVSAGNACAARSGGEYYCWGLNHLGQVGDGTTTQRNSPTEVAGVTGCVPGSSPSTGCNPYQTKITVSDTSCTIDSAGHAWCWGMNNNGEAGNNTTATSTLPVEVDGNHDDWIHLFTDSNTTCGIRGNSNTSTSGTLYCWGENADGQIGDNSTTQRLVPTLVSGGYTDWTSAQMHDRYTTCGTRENGTAWCWGNNTNGQIGDNSTTQRLVPTLVSGGYTNWIGVDPGYRMTCGTRGDGTGWCWGLNDGSSGLAGMLGDGTTTNRLVPSQLAGGYTDWVQIYSGVYSTCGLRSTGRAYCWGKNDTGQLGDGTITDRTVPTEVSGGYTDWQQIIATQASTGSACGIRGASRAIYCWGSNVYGQLGDGNKGTGLYSTYPVPLNTTASTSVDTCGGPAPVQITTNSGWVQVAAPRDTGCAIKDDGKFYCWGRNGPTESRIGNGTCGTDNPATIPNGNVTTAAQVSNITAPTSTLCSAGSDCYETIDADDASTCAIDGNGRAYCWGQVNGNATVPTEITGNYTDWTHISTSINTNVCGIRSGHLYCWGENSAGLLGDGNSPTDSAIPVEESGANIDWIDVNVGFKGACGIRGTSISTGGTLYCWGPNSEGQVGDNSTTQRNTPTLVSGGYTDWKDVAGDGTFCGIANSNRMYCWGSRIVGQIGDGGAVVGTQLTPALVSGGYTDWTIVNTSSSTACALRSNGTAWCWGGNAKGEVGTGILGGSYNTPQQVSGAYTDWTYIFRGQNNSCGIRSGRAYCWGDRTKSVIGDGGSTTGEQLTPTEIAGDYNDWKMVSVDQNHACGIRRNGSYYCWGSNTKGQLGDNSTMNRPTPTKISDLGGCAVGGCYETIEVDRAQSCAIDGNGRAFCWGTNNNGTIGDGTTTERHVPTEVSGGYTDWTDISSGPTTNTCGIRSGHAYCWGDNSTGMLGNGNNPTDSLTPVEVSGGYDDWLTVGIDDTGACGIRGTSITAGGTLYCWGFNDYGQVGDNSTTQRNIPTLVSGGYTDWKDVVHQFSSTCGIANGNRMYCWGNRQNGHVGDGGAVVGNQLTPIEVAGGFTDWTTVNSSAGGACALRATGQAYCWGINDNGEVGNNSTVGPVTSPTEVNGAYTDWTYIHRGYENSCGIRSGRAYCWGNRTNSVIGDGGSTVGNQLTPKEVAGGFTDWTQISTDNSHACGIRSTGNYYCWGTNTNGQLGDNTTTTRNMPVQVSGLTGCSGEGCSETLDNPFQSKIGGGESTCAVDKNGALWCWGENAEGQLGNGTTTGTSTPVPVSGGYTDWITVFGDRYTTCGIRGSSNTSTSGSLYCWGDNTNGQIGYGVTGGADVTSPQLVSGGFTDWKDVSNEYIINACGTRANGMAYCWGLNTYGEFGNGTSGTSSNVPTAVGTYSDWEGVFTSAGHTCGIRTNGEAYCWGDNNGTYGGAGTMGMVGDGTTTDRLIPTLVSGGFTDWVKVTGSGFRTCGLRGNGTVWCWGDNSEGTFGNGTTTDSLVPTEVGGGFTDWKYIQENNAHICGIRGENRLAYCWGKNLNGQLGDGTVVSPRLTPTLVSGGGMGWERINPGSNVTCGYKTNGNIYCWGKNAAPGYIGNGTSGADVTTPKRVSFIDRDTHELKTDTCTGETTCTGSITAGFETACAIGSDTKIWCWGANWQGQWGTGNNTSSNTPVAGYGGTTGWRKITNDVGTSGNSFTCALKDTGALYCAGRNTTNGTLGIGSAVSAAYYTPQLVSGGFTDWVDVDSDILHACALRATGQAYCWGNNNGGKIGDGTSGSPANDRTSPTLISGGFTDWTSVNTGSAHSCALRSTGLAYCWGTNGDSQLGDNTTVNKSNPTLVLGGYTDWVSIDAGHITTCGLRATGQAYCWGDNTNGQVGNNASGVDIKVPTEVDGAYTDWSEIATDNTYACGLRGGSIYCWGDRTMVPVQGDGGAAVGNQLTPSLILAGDGWKNLSVENNNACTVHNNGRFYCWGINDRGQVGDNTVVQKTLPTQVDTVTACATPTTPPASYIYVGDYLNDRVQVFSTLNNTFVRQFGSTGATNGLFNHGPAGNLTDGAGNIYVSDIGLDRVQKFTSAGVYVSQFGGSGATDGLFNGPWGMAFDQTGNIYVVDSGNHRVQKFTSAGVYVSQFGSSGVADGQFNTPAGIAIDSSGNIFVTDRSNHRVQKFDSAGVFVSKFGTAGAGNGQFNAPEGITTDSSGNIYVVDTGNDRVQKFTSAGVYVSQFGGSGAGPGLFIDPESIAIDGYNTIWVTDNNSAGNRVERFDINGNFLSQFNLNGVAGEASGISFGRD